MANTFFGLTIGKSGLYAASTALNTTAHNIANTETEGYCRQVATQAASKALYVGNSSGMVGTGVDVISVDQIRDEYYDVKYRANNTLYGEYSSKEYYMTEIENYFNEIKLEGFTTTFDDLFASLQEAGKNPSDLTVRTQMTNYAEAFCEYFSYLSTNIKKVQQELNFEVYNQVSKINSLGLQMAELTKQINALEVLGGTASDLRDQRALLIDELSGMVEVSVTEVPVAQKVGVNSFTVRINGQLLVDTYNSNELLCVPREKKITMNDVAGLYDIVWAENGQEFNASTSSETGSLSSLYAVMEGNDQQAFKGMAVGYIGESVITLTSDFDYMNKTQKLNLPTQGVLTIGNRKYEYNGFKISHDEDGKYVYEFALDSPLLVGTDEVTPATDYLSGFQYNTVIGRDIDYKGIPYYMSQMNEFVRVFSQRFNDIHKQGVDLNGDKGLDFFNCAHVVNGVDYTFVDGWPYQPEETDVLFSSKTGSYTVENDEHNYGSYYFMTVDNLKITKDIMDDARKVAAATEIVNGVERSDIVAELLSLKADTGMFRQGAPASFLQSLVSEIGIDSRKSHNFASNQKDILESVTNQRLSVSGVDQDEEAMNLVRFQSAYNLSSKVVSVMNEIYDKLINYMGA